ncbi:TetR/AcrR family transcriptional regulator [Hyphomonas sp. WL0036]|uniref:TetR/AcrR family transcriptional regulator n=1 Tax=Hyphomonas sediminis TaxID=2866160 RepID=UPI001C7F6825|nr:TetR/AcrR family transcriptional regulator [Hyphomonas sediminis]MBY9068083.1 TetR/AcrR family transcriptional regulator [Hyphomonas sediminis]
MSSAKKPSARKAAEPPPQVVTTTKQQPQQARAQDTFELILETAGHLLDEVGLERLSTNLVCRRAGLSPPALYRYFPNKYAILRELGDRLMALQDQAVLDWIGEGGMNTRTIEDAIESNIRLQERVNDITRQFPGNIFVLRALRAIPLLREVRLASSDMVAERIADGMIQNGHKASRERLIASARLTTELAYSAMEMVLEEPDRDTRQILTDVSRMIALHYAGLNG